MNFKKISIQDRKKKNCITLDHTEPGEKDNCKMSTLGNLRAEIPCKVRRLL